MCRTKPGKKNDAEAVETRSELHIVTRGESAQNVKKMPFKVHETCFRKKKKAPAVDFFSSDELQSGVFSLLLAAKTQWHVDLPGLRTEL